MYSSAELYRVSLAFVASFANRMPRARKPSPDDRFWHHADPSAEIAAGCCAFGSKRRGGCPLKGIWVNGGNKNAELL